MERQLNRRDFLGGATAAMAVAAWPGRGWAAAPLCRMGIASTSFMGAEIGSGPGSARPAGPPRPRDTMAFLEKCAALGAGGIQAAINGDPVRVRARAEELGMYLEGMVGIPRNGDMTALDRGLADAKAAGVKVVRAAMLSGRRYETFASLADWKKWVDEAHAALRLAMPIIEKHKVVVALENHKDWTLEDFLLLLKTWSSEYLQVCLDFGNNISLLDDPMAVIEGLAPYAQSTHIKDMAVQPYQDGFLLSEVPLGDGLLDLPKIVSVILKANPKARFSLEMITRDPLKVPCMTPKYWEVFPDRNGRYLAQTLRLLRDHSSRTPLPTVSQLSPEQRAKVEEENVKACIRYVNEKQLIP
ncbi:MAG: TIM barrel protein [Blastocatellia bacterium]|nr:TIM barrel protein [Blastocatellia bacterium]